MKLLERAAREIGLALGDCGGTESGRLVDELALLLSELGSQPKRRRMGGLFRLARLAPSPRGKRRASGQ
jgi:hypothetical protein